MAECSFKAEVEYLRLGEGETFTGEGILAITKALLENGVGYVGGYQGAPISHLMDVLGDAENLMAELGIRFEANASEAAATAMLAASVHYPIRGAVTFKGPVGVNVVSDALANLSSSGVAGGALIVVGEDYGEGSSIMQERSHAFAMKSQFWLLDPRPNLPSIVKAVGDGFALSEASNTPVMLMVRIRACHVTGQFETRNNKRPPLTVTEALANPRRDFSRALQRLGLADINGETQVPIYCLNVTYPLVQDEFLDFCKGKQAVMVVEEGQPEFIEQQLGAILYKARSSVQLHGKDMLPVAGEYTGQVMLDGVTEFINAHAPDLLPDIARAPNVLPPTIPDLSKTVPIRPPPGFCIGCPERPIFAAVKLVQNELGKHQISADIGCHPISDALKGVGVKWIRQINHTYDVAAMRDVIREALTTPEKGPKVIVASSECMLNKERREKPLRHAAIADGRRVETPRFGIDEETCTGDACLHTPVWMPVAWLEKARRSVAG